MQDGPYNDVVPWNYHLLPQLLGNGSGFAVETEGQLEEALQHAKNETQTFTLLDVRLDRLDRSPALDRLAKNLGETAKGDEVILLRNHVDKRRDVGLQENQNSNQRSQHEAVDKNKAQDRPFLPVPICRGAGDDDALRIDHFAHDAAGTVRRRHENGTDASLLRGDGLQIAEQDI